VALTDEAYRAMIVFRGYIEALAADPFPHYGVSTGFGALATHFIPVHQRARMQQAVVRSHTAGAGAEVAAEVVRAMALLRLRTLATGRTGVRPATAAALAKLLNARLTPVVPEHGTCECCWTAPT
jgi:histidine ammonia-lyase